MSVSVSTSLPSERFCYKQSTSEFSDRLFLLLTKPREYCAEGAKLQSWSFCNASKDMTRELEKSFNHNQIRGISIERYL